MSICIILARPRNPQNIGAAARAMGNFGLEDLRVVKPYAPVWQEAASAVGAHDILKNAKVYPDILSAAANCNFILAATSLKNRKVGQQIVSLPEIKNFLADYKDQNIAIVFGPEKTGLTAREIEQAHAILNIPTTAKVPSINLAQAVILCCYELSKNTIDTKSAEKQNLSTVKEQQIVAQNIKRLIALLDLPPTLNKNITDRKLNDLNARLALGKENIFFINTIIIKLLNKLKS